MELVAKGPLSEHSGNHRPVNELNPLRAFFELERTPGPPEPLRTTLLGRRLRAHLQATPNRPPETLRNCYNRHASIKGHAPIGTWKPFTHCEIWTIPDP